MAETADRNDPFVAFRFELNFDDLPVAAARRTICRSSGWMRLRQSPASRARSPGTSPKIRQVSSAQVTRFVSRSRSQ